MSTRLRTVYVLTINSRPWIATGPEDAFSRVERVKKLNPEARVTLRRVSLPGGAHGRT